MGSIETLGITLEIENARKFALNGEYDDANKLLSKAAYSSGRYKAGTLFGKANNDMGFNHIIQGTEHYERALECFQNVLTPEVVPFDIAIPPGQEAIALINAVGAKRQLRSDKKPAKRYTDVASGLVECGTYEEALLLDQIGQMSMGDPAIAFQYFEDALNVIEDISKRCDRGETPLMGEKGYDDRDVKRTEGMILTHAGIADMDRPGFNPERQQKCIDMYAKSDHIACNTDDGFLRYHALESMGKLGLRVGNYKQAMDYFTEAGVIAMRIRYHRGIALMCAYLGCYSYKHKEKVSANQFFSWVNHFLPELNQDDLDEVRRRIVDRTVSKAGKPRRNTPFRQFLDASYPSEY